MVLFAFFLLLLRNVTPVAPAIAGNEEEEEEEADNRKCCLHDEPLLSKEQVAKLDRLERISCEISREVFYQLYELPRIPVILQGCTHQWPASQQWKFDRLVQRNFPPSRKFKVTFDEQQDQWKMASWTEIQKAIQQNQFFYIFDQVRETAGAWVLKDDFRVPPQFRDADLYKDLIDFPPNYGPRRWFVMGSKTSGTNPHLDPSSTDAWNTALQGYKWWILFPPDDRISEDQLRCDPSCSAPRYTTKHWYATVGMNSNLTTTDALHVLQNPGETLYLPYGFVHSVYNFEDCIGVTENYASPADLNAIWQSIVLEGTVAHARTFFFLILNDAQRQQLLEESPYFDAASQLQIPLVLVRYVMTRVRMLLVAVSVMAGVVWFLLSLLALLEKKSQIPLPAKRISSSRKTVVLMSKMGSSTRTTTTTRRHSNKED